MGGLFGKLAEELVLGVARGATGVAFSSASTYALAQLAKRYYGGGRTMSTDTLKQTFDQLMTPAKDLQAKYLPQIQEKARSVNMGDAVSYTHLDVYKRQSDEPPVCTRYSSLTVSVSLSARKITRLPSGLMAKVVTSPFAIIAPEILLGTLAAIGEL